MLRPTPGALTSRRLEERPGNLPTGLYVHGGRQPIRFSALVFGMNFENMPELHWRYGYALSLLLLVVVAAVQVWVLKRRGWFQDWTTPR